MIEFLGISLIIVVVAIMAIMAWSLYYLLVKLPEQQTDILERFSPAACNQVRLKYRMLTEEQQSQIAEEKMRGIFSGFGVPYPGDTAIETVIGSIILGSKQNEADLWIEELKSDQIAQANTASMPITPILAGEFVL